MASLDKVAMPYNTPDERARIVNAPAWTAGLTLVTYPRPIPMDLIEWVTGAGTVSPYGHRGLVLYGPVGTGKTGVGVSALRILARSGVGSTFQWNMVTSPGVRAAVDSGDDRGEPSPCWFESWSRLLSLYRRETWDEQGWFDKLKDCVDVLMLDDIGVDVGTPYRESFLLRHVEWSYSAGRSLILTLNSPPADWSKAIGERAADRLQDKRWFLRVPFSGKSLR